MGNQDMKEIEFERNDDSLVITIPWFRGIDAILGIILMIASIYFLMKGGVGLVFAFLLGYIALGLIFNRTEIVVNNREIVIQHGPFPSPASKRSLLMTNFGEWRINVKKSYDDYGNVATTIHQLHVQNKASGKYVTLIKGGKSRGEIVLIRDEIDCFIRSIKKQHLTESNSDYEDQL